VTGDRSTQLDDGLRQPLVDLLLAIADDKFMLGHRNADWTGLAPILEEDIAFSSLAQDDIAHAGALYELVGRLTGRAPDAIAYGRKPEEYRCAAIVELCDDFDWAVAIVRQFLCDHFDFLRLTRLAASTWQPLRELAARLLAEERLAIGHADQWIVRLGGGGEDSRSRIQRAVDRLAPLACELFEPTRGQAQLEQSGVYPLLERRPDEGGAPDDGRRAGAAQRALDAGGMFRRWKDAIENVLEEATLHATLVPPAGGFVDGRQGRRSPPFAKMFEELTQVYRVEPDASW
jgi:ring-1,2-phenylacetyl-CoA epoxidase subunit PaaC